MDNKITKKRINDHLEYDWYKYLIILIAGIALFVFIFSQINRTRDYEDVAFFISCYDSPNENRFDETVLGDMNSSKYDSEKYGESVLREVSIEIQDPLDSNYGTMLQTHGMITSDVLIVGKSILENSGGGAYVPLTDELLEKYLLPKGLERRKEDGTKEKYDLTVDDLEYYTVELSNGETRRTGIKVSGFRDMNGASRKFGMNWRENSSYNDKYKDAEEENQPDDEFYLVINPSSVSIGEYGKGDRENKQALYLVNRFIAYYR